MANSRLLVGSSSDLPANKSSKAPGDVRAEFPETKESGEPKKKQILKELPPTGIINGIMA